MKIRPINLEDQSQVIQCIAEFRVEIALLKTKISPLNLKSAEIELKAYLRHNYPVFVAETDQKIVGYVICKVDDSVVWAEHLYVMPDFRRQGLASALYSEVEKLADSLGGDTAYNWVHPNNEGIIAFLKKRGYSVLNLIEIRKPWKDETPIQKISVGLHEFDY